MYSCLNARPPMPKISSSACLSLNPFCSSSRSLDSIRKIPGTVSVIRISFLQRFGARQVVGQPLKCWSGLRQPLSELHIIVEEVREALLESAENAFVAI